MCCGLSGSGSLSAIGRTAQKDVQAAVTFFDDVAELVVCEEKDTQVDSGVGLNPSFSRKLMILWCSLMKAAPRTMAYGRSRTTRNDIRNTLSTGENIMGITQDPMTSIGGTALSLGFAAWRDPFPAGLMSALPPHRLV